VNTMVRRPQGITGKYAGEARRGGKWSMELISVTSVQREGSSWLFVRNTFGNLPVCRKCRECVIA
jgi:hypothetical protein